MSRGLVDTLPTDFLFIFSKHVSHLWPDLKIAGLEAVDLGSPRHEAFGAILPFMNETIDGGDVEKEQVLLKNPVARSSRFVDIQVFTHGNF